MRRSSANKATHPNALIPMHTYLATVIVLQHQVLAAVAGVKRGTVLMLSASAAPGIWQL